jgi:hypothetical protein
LATKAMASAAIVAAKNFLNIVSLLLVVAS